VSCVAHSDNGLRFDCTVVVANPSSSVSVHFAEVSGPDRGTFESEASSVRDHDFVLWGMRPDRDHEVTVTVEGSVVATTGFRSGVLPDAFEQLSTVTTGSDPIIENLMVPLRCGGVPYMSIIDSEGSPLWYQQMGDENVGLFNLTPDGIIVLESRAIQEWSLEGELLRVLSQGEHFEHRVHHDAFVYEGLIYVLFAAAYPAGGQEVVLDGLYVFDESGAQVGQWELADHLDITPADLVGLPPRQFWAEEFPGAVDYSHANSVFVDESGIYVSTRWLSTVWKLGSFGTPEFGEVQWRLVGEAGMAVQQDFVLESDVSEVVTFKGQHHATIASDGTLTLFDNRRQPSTSSRVLAYDIDEGEQIAALVEVYELGELCDIQGTTVKTADGDWIAVCSNSGVVSHFRAGAVEPSFTLQTGCDAPPPDGMAYPRALPVSLP